MRGTTLTEQLVCQYFEQNLTDNSCGTKSTCRIVACILFAIIKKRILDLSKMPQRKVSDLPAFKISI